MINNIKPNSIVKEDFDNAMRNFCKKVTFNSHEYFKNTKMSYRPVYKPAGGRKYIKIKAFETNTVDHNGNKVVDTTGRIFCFVHHTTGDIYKAATYKAPYLKGNNAVRGNIFDPTTFEKTDPYGGAWYA